MIIHRILTETNGYLAFTFAGIVDDEIVASATVQLNPKRTLDDLFVVKLETLYVIPAHRRCGYGRALLNEIIESSISSGKNVVVVGLNKENEGAITLFRSIGGYSFTAPDEYGFIWYAYHIPWEKRQNRSKEILLNYTYHRKEYIFRP
jgi:ribosomal protein S18 acetylase RimI-like enzyme